MLMQLFSEAKILEALSHPNIIKLYEFYKTKSDKLVLILEYAKGEDLHKKIKQRKKKHFPEKQIKKWIFQLSTALKHSHDHKILHRDLKTTNIFLDEKNNIKLGDFGLAKNLCKIEFSIGGMLGTPVYLAPEVIEHSKITLKSDIWALGIVFYEIMSLNFPFFATDLSSLIKKICNDDLEELPSVFSTELKEFVFWILNKDPDQRPGIEAIIKSDFFIGIHRDIYGEEVFDKIKIKSDFRISENGLRRDFKELRVYRHSEYKKTIDLALVKNNKPSKDSVFKKNLENESDQLLEESDVFSNSSFVQKIKSNNQINDDINFGNDFEESKIQNIMYRDADFTNNFEESELKNDNEDLKFSDIDEFENSIILEIEKKSEKSFNSKEFSIIQKEVNKENSPKIKKKMIKIKNSKEKNLLKKKKKKKK